MKSKTSANIYPWNDADKKVIERLDSPQKIQAFLDQTTYNSSSRIWLPSEVLKLKNAHCFDGAVFAASVLGFHGEEPLLVDMQAYRDHDHILAIYKRDKFYGAISKSNYVGLRYREPIFRTVRELVLSYFESYYNHKKQKSLRGYSLPYDLRKMGSINWEERHLAFEQIAQVLTALPHKSLLTREQERHLNLVDSRSFSAGLVGAV